MRGHRTRLFIESVVRGSSDLSSVTGKLRFSGTFAGEAFETEAELEGVLELLSVFGVFRPQASKLKSTATHSAIADTRALIFKT
jgi:hypothetical protein